MHDGKINLFDFTALKLGSERLVCRIGTSYRQHAASFPVQTMYDARTEIPIHGRQSSEVMQQSVDQRSFVMPCPGVNHHSSGLIDYHDIVILIQDGERQFFGTGFERRKVRGLYSYGCTGSNEMRCANGLAVEEHAPVLDPGLNARAAEFWQTLMHKGVQTLACILGLGNEVHVPG
jgi:hypothetical protein